MAPQMIGLDIETDTSIGGLDPEVAAIVAIALALPGSDEVLCGDEPTVLARTDELLAAAGTGLLVTWNGAGFDLPFIAHRAATHGLTLGLETLDAPERRSAREPERPAVRARWHSLSHLDGYRLYRGDVGRSLPISCALKALARLVGLDPVELDRETLHLADPAALAAYAASDARTAVELVARRMPLAAAAADFPLPLRPPDPRSTARS